MALRGRNYSDVKGTPIPLHSTLSILQNQMVALLPLTANTLVESQQVKAFMQDRASQSRDCIKLEEEEVTSLPSTREQSSLDDGLIWFWWFSGEDEKHLWNVSKTHSSESFLDKVLFPVCVYRLREEKRNFLKKMDNQYRSVYIEQSRDF
ncbi:hypothetical protein P5673_031346 [Acropora cervicornis]|uniref:Uncharacterized protein n=1 Tax=Acropora cervicornis TaxID=6130 RepID=A0AAD9PT78_ACRCE|nr:hypothetical protein P5673_031346 [Acropora cervicornis]